jgi:cytochrome bd-type quinol oxidase subunit 1
MDVTALHLSRLQFAFTVSFHMVSATLSILQQLSGGRLA